MPAERSLIDSFFAILTRYSLLIARMFHDAR